MSTKSNKTGAFIFTCLVAITGFVLAFSGIRTQSVLATNFPPGAISAIGSSSGVRVRGELSQTKLIQGSNGVMYLTLSINTPDIKSEGEGRKPTDMVVVLDRSPSMADANKFPYALAAIRDLITRLDSKDRFALISFDATARVETEFTEVTPEARERLLSRVSAITLGSATNIGDGLIRAKELISRNRSGRNVRVLLLSDGETNTGIIEPSALSKLAADFPKAETVLSAIGMGLGFNENLMSSLADHGMGNYSYLENLASLQSILAKDLEDSRACYAKGSFIRMELSPGVTITDAGGYPIERDSGNSQLVKVPTGQLIGGSMRSMVVTFNTPTSSLGDISLGKLSFVVSDEKTGEELSIPRENLLVSVLAPERREEAVASVRSEVYRQSWTRNNFGLMQKDVQGYLRRGDRSQAMASIDKYKEDLKKAESQSGVKLSDDEVNSKLSKIEADVRDSFTGNTNEQEEKRNRLGKALYSSGVSEQRMEGSSK